MIHMHLLSLLMEISGYCARGVLLPHLWFHVVWSIYQKTTHPHIYCLYLVNFLLDSCEIKIASHGTDLYPKTFCQFMQFSNVLSLCNRIGISAQHRNVGTREIGWTGLGHLLQQPTCPGSYGRTKVRQHRHTEKKH